MAGVCRVGEDLDDEVSADGDVRGDDEPRVLGRGGGGGLGYRRGL